MYLDGTWVTAGCCTYLCHLWGLCAPDYSKTYTCVQPLSWMCVFSPNICFSIHNNLCVHMQYLGVLLAALTRGIYIACAHRTLCCATGLLRLSLQLMLSLFPPKVYCNVTNCATHTHVFFHIFISCITMYILWRSCQNKQQHHNKSWRGGEATTQHNGNSWSSNKLRTIKMSN